MNDVGKGERPRHERRGGPQRALDEPACYWPRACRARLAGGSRSAVDEDISGEQQPERDRDEDRLVGSERRQRAHPRAREPEGEQGERHDAAGGCGQGSEQACRREPARPDRDLPRKPGLFSRGLENRGGRAFRHDILTLRHRGRGGRDATCSDYRFKGFFMRSQPPGMSTRLTIGTLSERTGCNIETIRYYERIGLMPRTARSAGGHRLYGEEHVKRLGFIRRSRELGFTLDQVRTLLALVDGRRYTCAQVKRITVEHLDEVHRKVADLRTNAGRAQSRRLGGSASSSSCCGMLVRERDQTAWPQPPQPILFAEPPVTPASSVRVGFSLSHASELGLAGQEAKRNYSDPWSAEAH